MKILNLLKPSIFIFYFKQFLLLRKFKNKLTISAFRLTYEKNVDFIIEENSKIEFGNQITLRKGVDIQSYGRAKIQIGDSFFINKNSSIISRFGITIGDNCMIGENTSIIDHNHSFENNDIPFNKQGYKGSPIIIGNNVWIASRVFISHGVTIGDNVVIGANTIVTKSIPSNSTVYSKNDLVIKEIKK